MVQTRAQRKRQETLPKQKPQKPKKSKKKSKKPRKPRKSKKVEMIVEEKEDILDINEVAKNYKISNEPLKHKSKSKEQNRKDHKKFYDMHFFEVLRKQTEKRWLKGYRVRYGTLKKYHLVNEYKAWKEKLVKQGLTRFQEHLDLLKNEIIYQERFDQNIEEYVNPTAKYVSRVLATNNIGTGIQPNSIQISINPDNTPEVENEELEFNQNYSQQQNQVIIEESQEEKEEAEMTYSQADMQPYPNNSRLDAWYTKNKIPRKFTLADARKWFFSDKNLYRGRNPSAKQNKANYDSIKKLIDVLACDPLDNRKFEMVKGNKEELYKNNVPGKLVFKTENGKKLEDKRANPKNPPLDVDLLECFNVKDKYEIRQKVQLIGQRKKKGGGVRRHMGKNIFSAIRVLLREANNSVVNHSPFKYLIGERQAKLWNAEFDIVMKKYHETEDKEKDQGINRSLKWSKLEKAYQILEQKWLKMKKKKPRPNMTQQQKDLFLLEKFNLNIDYVLFSCYILRPPVRDDYGECRLLSPKDKIIDYLKTPYNPTYLANGVVSALGAAEREAEQPSGNYYNYYSISEQVFVMQRYKTQAIYKQRRYDLTKLKSPYGNGAKLAKIIAESYKLYPREWLIAKVRLPEDVRKGNFRRIVEIHKKGSNIRKEATRAESEPKTTLSKRIARIQREGGITKNPYNNGKGNLGFNLMRHAKISNLIRVVWKGNPTNDQRAILAEMMLHSVNQARRYNYSIEA